MKISYLFRLSAVATVVLATAAASAQSIPNGYPASYANLVSKAKQEGVIAIYTSTDQSQSQPLLDAFHAAYPDIKIEYNDLGTTGSFNRAISEAAAHQEGADIVWTSAMDLQLQLVEKHLAATYQSPEASHLPSWAIYKDAAFGTTIEPEAIIYNKTLFKGKVPETRDELTKLLRDKKEELKGKVATFDPEKSGTGYLYLSYDERHSKNFWDLARAFGGVQGKVYGSSGAMREKILSGEHVLAFDTIGSYATDWAKKSPNLGVAYTKDYTAAFSRVAVVMKDAKHPNAARVFLDFLLSERGQKALASRDIPSIRNDFQGEGLASLNKEINGNLQPIALDKALLKSSEAMNRVQFFKSWKKALNTGK